MPLQTVSQVLAGMKARNVAKREYVDDWRKLLPPGSRWWPGCPGNPSCQVCEGTGYVRFEGVEIGSPLFGRIFLCDCVAQMRPTMIDPNLERP